MVNSTFPLPSPNRECYHVLWHFTHWKDSHNILLTNVAYPILSICTPIHLIFIFITRLHLELSYVLGYKHCHLTMIPYHTHAQQGRAVVSCLAQSAEQILTNAWSRSDEAFSGFIVNTNHEPRRPVLPGRPLVSIASNKFWDEKAWKSKRSKLNAVNSVGTN